MRGPGTRWPEGGPAAGALGNGQHRHEPGCAVGRRRRDDLGGDGPAQRGDLGRVRHGIALHLADEDVVELVLDETGHPADRPVGECADVGEPTGKAELLADALLSGGDEILAGLGVAAARVCPDQREVVLRPGALLEQHEPV